MIKFIKKRSNVERKKKKSKFISHEFPRFLKKSSSSHRFIILRIESRFKFAADFKLVRFRLKINNDLREMESEESLLSLSCARERAPPLSLHFEFEHEFETIRQVHKFCTSASLPSPPSFTWRRARIVALSAFCPYNWEISVCRTYREDRYMDIYGGISF